jgi:long-subunit fatty acid transport protein
MKRTLINIAILSTILGTGMAQAGGFDVSGQDTSIILKEGNLLEITSVSVTPSVTGAYSNVLSGGVVSDVAPDYSFTNLAFRTDISEGISLAVVKDQPYGAKVNWTDGEARESNGAVSYNGVKADIKSDATTLLMSYDVQNNVTVYGGIKSQSISATNSNPVAAYYTISSNTDSSIGYVLGAAVEKPEIAMRISLTYHSKVGHDLDIVETNLAGVAALPSPHSTTMSFETPEAFNLDFQTGIAQNTLLFGTIRHVKWTQFELRPTIYNGLTGGSALKDYDNNVTTYSLGLGRKLNDQWSAAVTYGTEAATGEYGSALGPTDGYKKVGVGVTYTGEKMSVTLGVQKAKLGGTIIPEKTMSTGSTISSVNFTGNTTLVTALKVGYKF